MRRWIGRGAAACGALVLITIAITVADPLGRARRKRSVIPSEVTFAGDPIVAGRVCLRLRAPLRPQIQDLLHHYGVTLEQRLEPGVDVLSIPAAAPPELVAEAFGRLEEVEFCEPDPIFDSELEVNDPSAASQWHLATVHAEDAWNVSQGNPTVSIAVVDTGVDPDHVDLAEKLLPGWSFVTNSSDTHDENGHGTHVAGIAAAATDNGVGVAGLGFGCSILPIQVLRADGTGSGSDVAAGIVYAARHGAKVINLSLGSSAPSATVRSAVRRATELGSLVVAAAGNSGSSAPHYPAFEKETVAVGASTPADERADFSNYDASWVDLAAPGTSIVSTFPLGTVTLGTSITGYKALSGTSMATPVVSGAAALLFAYMGPHATPAAVRAHLESTADASARSWTAFGRLDAGAALARAVQVGIPIEGTVRSVAVRYGRWRRGDLASLLAHGRETFQVAADGERGSRAAEVEVDADGLTGTLTSLVLRIRGRSSVYASQTVSVYDWPADRFEVVDESFSRGRFQERAIDLSGNATSYVRSGLLRFQVRQEAGPAFTSTIDRVVVSATSRQ